MRIAPLCVRATADARHSLHTGDWTLATIADDIDAELRWSDAPAGILGMIVAEHGRSVITLAEHVRESEQETYIMARLLAEAIEARASGSGEPHVRFCARYAWKHTPLLRPYWAAGAMLAVSLADVSAMLTGGATSAEIGARRGVPSWFAELRIAQEIMYGTIDGDQYGALARVARSGGLLLDWIARVGDSDRVSA